jgi:hypothetical protein
MELSLAGLRDQLMRQMVTQAFIDDTGHLSYMTLIPRFKTAGLPQAELNGMEMGGFWVDTYQASQPDATSTSRGSTSANSPGETPAVSRAGVVPWTNISQTSAKIACGNRVINGVACHLMTMEEWAAIAYLAWMYDPELRGNTNSGSDHRDPNSWEYRGIDDPVQSGRTLTGSGPASWRLFGQHVADLVGNVWEWLDFTIEDGLWTDPDTGLKYCLAPPGGSAAILAAELSDDPSISTIPFSYDPDYVGPPLPAQGTIQLWNEQVSYTGRTGTELEPGTLTGCVRGANGSGIAVHPAQRRFATVHPQFNSTPSGAGDYGAYGQAKLELLGAIDPLRRLALPAEVSSGGSSEYGKLHLYYWRSYGFRAARRGGNFGDGSGAGVFALSLYYLPSSAYYYDGFRAAMSI